MNYFYCVFNKLSLQVFKLYKFLKINNQQILKFFVSGVIASSLNFISYRTSYLILKNILLASIFGYLVGILASFIFAKAWVFKQRSSKPLVNSFFLFCLIYLLGGIEMTSVIVFTNLLIDNYKIAWLFGALIGSINNYLGSKYILFKK